MLSYLTASSRHLTRVFLNKKFGWAGQSFSVWSTCWLGITTEAVSFSLTCITGCYLPCIHFCLERLIIFILWVLSLFDYIFPSFCPHFLLLIYLNTPLKNSIMVFWELTSVFFVADTWAYSPKMESHYIRWPSLCWNNRESLRLIMMTSAVFVNKEGICYVVMDAQELFTQVKSWLLHLFNELVFMTMVYVWWLLMSSALYKTYFCFSANWS